MMSQQESRPIRHRPSSRVRSASVARADRRAWRVGFVLTVAMLVSSCAAHANHPEPPEHIVVSHFMIQGPQGRLAGDRAGVGAGLPVLFLHADAGRASQWREVMTEIASTRHVAAFDFRGHGDSDPAADNDYSFSGRGADVAAVADAVTFRRFVLVTHSGGAAAALAFAATHADRVAGILMVDPLTDPRAMPQQVRDKFVADLAGPQSLEVMRAYYGSIAGKNAAVRQRVRDDVDHVKPEARAGVGRAFAEWTPDPSLHAFTGPMLILATTPNDNAGALYRLRPDIPHRIIADSGHWLQLDQPSIVEHAITEFLASIEAGTESGRRGKD